MPQAYTSITTIPIMEDVPGAAADPYINPYIIGWYWLGYDVSRRRNSAVVPHVSLHSEKSPVRPMLFYSTNYWHQFWVQFMV